MAWKLKLGPIGKRLLIIPPVLIGGLVLAHFTKNRADSPREKPQEVARALRVIRVPKVDLVPRAIGHGSVTQGRVWRAIAEVKGRVVQVHPELKSGLLLKKGELVLRIDATEYDLAVARLDSEIKQIDAQLAEMDTQKLNLDDSLGIETKSLQIAEATLARSRKAAAENAVSTAQVEQEERTALAQKTSVQSIKNSLAKLPSQKDALAASLAAKKTQRQQAVLDQGKTTIKAPFNCRVGDVRIEPDQFLAGGSVLFEAVGTDQAEIEAQFTIQQIRRLLRPKSRSLMTGAVPDMQQIREAVNSKAYVRLRTGGLVIQWVAHFQGFRASIDPKTHTVGVVLTVDKPYEQAIPGERPPLMQGMFLEVELVAETRPDSIVIPRAAIDHWAVRLVDPQNRLIFQPVQIDYEQDDFAVLESGLVGGETLIVSDVTPAIRGMLIDPISIDWSRLRRLFEQATRKAGTTPLMTVEKLRFEMLHMMKEQPHPDGVDQDNNDSPNKSEASDD